MFKKGIYSNEARNKMVTGAEALAKSVKCTLGGKGRNAILINEKGLPVITKDGVSVAQFYTDMKDPYENAGASLLRDVASRTVAIAGDGCQLLSAKIATPNGWTTMGEIKVGDTICGTYDSFQKVIGVFPKGEREIYKVTTDDGRVTECSGDHLWEVWDHDNGKHVLSAEEIYYSRTYYSIPLTSVEFNKVDVELDAYEYGKSFNSKTPFIDKTYMFNSLDVRRDLLSGIIEAMGCYVDNAFEIEVEAKILIEDIIDLCRSLGLVVVYDKTRNIIFSIDKTFYKIGFTIEKLDKKEPVQCIKVTNDDHLYITDDFIVTHNTSSSIVLGEAIIKEANKYIKGNFFRKGKNPIDIKKGIDKALTYVLSELDEMSIDVSSTEDIKKIATISTNGDEELGQLIADAMDLVGYDGLIEVDTSNKTENELELIEGMEIETTHITHHFLDDMKAEFENPIIFLYDGKITRIAEIANILNIAVNKNRPIIFVCDDMIGEALAVFLKNVKDPSNNLNGCVIKAPSINEYRIDLMRDIGVYTGGGFNSVINGGFDISTVTSETLIAGSCDKFKIHKNGFTIINGHSNEEEKEARIEYIKSQIESESDASLKVRYTKRLAKLTGGLAYIKLGASSQVELKEKYDRVDDALRSTRCGVEEGIVAGGGIALYNIAKKSFPKTTCKTDKIGQEIIKKVLMYPFNVILDNSGVNPKKIDNKLTKIGVNTYGYDVRGEKIVNMIDSGIIDPVKVTKTALINAVSVTGLFITAECAIAPILEEHDYNRQPPMMLPPNMMG